MLTIVWNTEGFHVVDLLPKGATFDTDYSCEDIPSEILRACPVHSNRRLVGHAGNARKHAWKRTREFMEKNNSRGASHPAFSHDLAHSDFLLFGCITGKLQETEFMETDDIHAEIGEILNGISGKVLKVVFVE
jgi:hypothetical protein